jgi:uncharacterized protein YwqG
MGEKLAILITIGITLPLAVLLIYFAFRNFFASIRNVKDTIDAEVGHRGAFDTKGPSNDEGPVSNQRTRSVESPAESKPAAGYRLQGANAATLTSVMFAEFQEQAKRSDEAHKAKIRAHVRRPVPPITPEGREAIELGRRARLAIKHVFPPRLPQRSMSYFGGLPIVPDDFDWPTLHNSKGLLERLNFMAQIDCSDLPPGPGRHLFPDKGYLYFFAPMSGTFGPDAMHFVVRYEPRQVTQKWEPLDMPFTGAIEPGDRMDMIWRGKRTHYDRFEIEFGWIEEPTDDEVAARSDEGHAFKVADKIRAEKLDAFYGPAVPLDPMLSAYHAPKDALWTPYPGFPANWRTARIIRKFVEAYHREETEDVANRLKTLGNVTEDDPEAQRLKTLQRELSKMSMRIGNAFFPTINAGLKEYHAPSLEVKQQIMTFLEDLRVNGMPSSKERRYGHLRVPAVINQWLEIAAIHGAEDGLTHPEGAALIAPEVIAALAHRHGSRKHQMLGEGEVVQVAADEMKDRYLLLLQLGPDAALDWTVGEMGPLQYWITPEDLAAKRFENTILTIEAY